MFIYIYNELIITTEQLNNYTEDQIVPFNEYDQIPDDIIPLPAPPQSNSVFT